ncbi:MAG: hypothetical protein JWO53_517 [Chlamydiia bacterium]|nr:hypothetical protein [Chlamydiia bacterium]
MTLEPLTLAHQSLLSTSFSQLQLDISEYSFAHLYLFRNLQEYQLLFAEQLFIKGKTTDGATFLMPTLDIRTVDINLLCKLIKSCDFIYPLPEEWASYFTEAGFKVTFSENDSDYVYTLEKLRLYPGRHLSSRRNLLHQFEDLYSVTVEDLIPTDALQLLDLWQTHVQKEIGKTDYEACKEAIIRHQELHLVGRLYKVDQKPIGFIIGEAVNRSTFVMHFSKADTTYKGVYQYMYQAFAKELDDHVQYINLEQDLGDLGLRRYKESYGPDKRIKKMRISL